MGSYLQETLRCKGTKICSPFTREINGKEVIGYVSSGTGEVFAYSEGKHSALAYTGGEPYGAVFDAHGKVHIADCAHAAILRVDLANHSHQPGIVVKVYEEKPFRGPSSIAISPANTTTYFTDSGPLGETTLENPRGSVFCIAANPSGGQILKPLALDCLAHPCAVAVSPDSKLVYVAEMMANRVLRFVQRPPGIYHMSVFYQFAGGLGPSCVACDTAGRVYVGSYDMAGADAANGRIYVLSAQGTLEHVLEVPGQEITGLCVECVLQPFHVKVSFSPADTTRGTHKMYVTEATTNALHCISLDAILKS